MQYLFLVAALILFPFPLDPVATVLVSCTTPISARSNSFHHVTRTTYAAETMHLSVFLTLTLSSTFTLFPSLTTARNSFLSHAHKVAVKHSSSLARDLRIAFGGVLVAQPGSAPTQNVYCVSDGGGVIVSSGNGNSSSPSGTSTASSSQPATTSVPPSSWKPIATYSGSTFFNGWTFFTAADPTNGNVQYVDQGTAQGAGLIEINSAGNAVMRVETTPTVQSNRMSVRITTNLTFTEGLVILDAVHMPTGCGTWPGGYHFFSFHKWH